MKTENDASLIIDATNGRIITAENADEIRHPASLTKMMTLYLTFQALDAGKIQLNQRLWVSTNAAEQSPTKLGLRAGQTIRVEDAILGLVTCSANDSAVVLAEHLGGNEDNFAHMMSRQAHALGMVSTRFKNASGLPHPEQITTAADMARLGFALINHYPHFYGYFGTRTFSYAGALYRNHNRLMAQYDGMDGIKTGYINASGFNLVASAVRGNRRLIGVVFGGESASSRDRKMKTLFDTAFTQTSAQGGQIRLISGETVDRGPHYAGDVLGLPGKAPAFFPPVREAQVYPTFQPQAPEPVVIAANTLDNEESEFPAAQEESTPSIPTPKVAAPIPPRMPTLPQKSAKKRTVGEWSIQVGAYNSESAGKKALSAISRNLSKTLKGSKTSLQKIAIENKPVYRARFVGLDETSARKACSTLLQKDHSCLIILPQ